MSSRKRPLQIIVIFFIGFADFTWVMGFYCFIVLLHHSFSYFIIVFNSFYSFYGFFRLYFVILFIIYEYFKSAVGNRRFHLLPDVQDSAGLGRLTRTSL